MQSERGGIGEQRCIEAKAEDIEAHATVARKAGRSDAE
jgi:hypothetical protein